jgi:S1-C subfamily serine protease
VDGYFGPRTKRAIEAFQKDYGVPVEGQTSKTLLAALNAAVQSKTQALTQKRNVANRPSFEWPSWRRVETSLPPSIPDGSQRPEEIYEASKRSVWIVVAGRSELEFKNLRELSQGSAIAISQDHLITNCHIVTDRPIIAILQGEKIEKASLVSAHPSSDRCILKVAYKFLSPVRGIRRFSALKVGERVYSVGAPRGLEMTLGEGIISGLRNLKTSQFVQTSAPISHGSSGGGLFDASANLVGITTFLLRESQSINFAISAEDYWR